jgi:hypothetical protein
LSITGIYAEIQPCIPPTLTHRNGSTLSREASRFETGGAEPTLKNELVPMRDHREPGFAAGLLRGRIPKSLMSRNNFVNAITIMSTASQNPTINKSGTATFQAPYYCKWTTANGTSSTLTITNQSNANTMSLSISGAPNSGILVSVNGVAQDSLNGFYEIPPNQPTYRIQANGDFLGTLVTITNNTNTAKNASALVQVVTAS